VSAPAQSEVLAALARVFRKLRARWYVFGAAAVSVRARPRLTDDLDVTVLIAPGQRQDLVDAVRAAGFTFEHDFATILRTSAVLRTRHRRTKLPIDIVIGGPGLEEEFAERASLIKFGRTRVPVISTEDLLACKLLAGRPKDLEDVRALLREDIVDLARARALLKRIESELDQSDLSPMLELLLKERRGRR